MICVLCKKADVRPPACCNKCGRLVCKKCRKVEYEPMPGVRGGKGPHETVIVCKFCLAERELST